MKLATTSRLRALWLGLALTLAAVPSAHALTSVLEEHVTGGAMDLTWLPGLGIQNKLLPLTIAAGHPAFPNPSGDGTVGVATTSFTDVDLPVQML